MRWDNNKVPKQIIAMALDDLILKNSDKEWVKSAIKDLEKVGKMTDKSIYEVMEMIVNDMTNKGYYKF